MIAYKVFKTIVHGNLELDASAQQLSSGEVSKVVTVQADPENNGYVFVGSSNTVSSSSFGAKLSAGSSVTLNIRNVNMIYVLGTSGDNVNYIVER